MIENKTFEVDPTKANLVSRKANQRCPEKLNKPLSGKSATNRA
jgi:hypothetical protein